MKQPTKSMFDAPSASLPSMFDAPGAVADCKPNHKTPTMSSLEIAELTGKRHDNVLRDIEEMLAALEEPLLKTEEPPETGKGGVLSFEDTPIRGSYTNPQNGQVYPCFHLPQDLTLTLVAGYSVVLRHRIIKRWLELELEVAKKTLSIPGLPPALALAVAESPEAHLVGVLHALPVEDRDRFARQALKVADPVTRFAYRGKVVRVIHVKGVLWFCASDLGHLLAQAVVPGRWWDGFTDIQPELYHEVLENGVWFEVAFIQASTLDKLYKLTLKPQVARICRWMRGLES